MGATTVTNNLDDLSGFNADAGWSVTAGVATNSGQSQFATMTTGVPAPVDVGDSVTASILHRVGVGSTIPTVANQYATRIAITGNDSGGGGNAKSMWTRRQPNTGLIWGHALTAPSVTGGAWSFAGWNNNSEISLATPTNATSAWFTAELTIVKQAVGYDLTIDYLDSSNTSLSTASLTGINLDNGLDSASTWYLNFGTEYQSTPADIASMEVDSVTLTSSIDVVPEPSSALLAGLATLGLIRRRRH